VSKNTFIAFILILLTIFFFQWYEAKKLQNYSNLNASIEQKKEQKDTVIQNKVDTIKEKIILLDTVNRKEEIETGDTIWIDNERIICGISEIGAKIISLKIKDYTYDKTKRKEKNVNDMVDLVGRSKVGGSNLIIGSEDFDNKKFLLKNNLERKNIIIKDKEKITLNFETVSKNGEIIQKRYSFEGDSYKIGVEIFSENLYEKSIYFGWKAGITESEYYKSEKTYTSYINEYRKAHIFDGKNIDHIQHKKIEKEEKTGNYKWTAITSKYFMIACVLDTIKDADIFIQSYDSKEEDDIKPINKKEKIFDYSILFKRVCSSNKESFWIYAGPNKISLLSSFKIKFEKVLFGGWEWFLRADIWFPIICEWTLWLLIFIYSGVKDYGITIIILTIFIRLITFPLSHSSMKSMNKMKILQPKINNIRQRYKTNPKKMNEEIMALYKKEGINPLNPGCLPMFLQMPVLIALFIVLQKAIELRGAQTILIPWVKDLSQPEILISLKQLGLESIFPNGIPIYGYGIALMPILMAILTFIQNKMTIKDPNQKAMIYFMPIFMLVLFNNFPAGLVFYWTLSNALGIIQQYILDKKMNKETYQIQEKQDKKKNRK
jgi:YidC/Oxa1 family membrane protein insertase